VSLMGHSARTPDHASLPSDNRSRYRSRRATLGARSHRARGAFISRGLGA
jgi:hypothetical protein